MILVILFIFLSMGLFIINFRLKIRARDKELSIANDKLEQYMALIDQHVISSQTDVEGIITSVSSAFCRTSEYSESELIGVSHNIVRHPDTSKEFYREMWETIQSGKPWSGEFKNVSKHGSTFWVNANMKPVFNKYSEIIGYVSVRSDVTEKKIIEKLSITDKLTDIYNRHYLDEVLNREFSRMQRYEGELSIIICDVDNFKKINDELGHMLGDQVLIGIAQLLKQYTREVDVVGRWGGEEFLIVCTDTSLQDAVNLAEKLRVKVEAHVFLSVGKATVSFGVTALSMHDSVEEAMQSADKALYSAKEKGRNRTEFFHEDL